MNTTIETLLNHRSIRKWKATAVPETVVATLFEVANRASTSNGMQNASIIRVKSAEKKAALAKIGKQAYMEMAPELWVFIVDNFRNVRIMEELGAEHIAANDVDRFFQGWTDATIMAQTVAIAAESLGLGIVYFGSILNDQAKVIEVLNLPENTYPVVGLGIGYADQHPQLKPRMDLQDKVFEDEYLVRDAYLTEFLDYDNRMQTYYDLRDTSRPQAAFTQQVVEKNTRPVAKRADTLKIMKAQGFQVKD